MRSTYKLFMTGENWKEMDTQARFQIKEITDQAIRAFEVDEREYKSLRRAEKWGRARYHLRKMKESYGGIDELSRKVTALE